MAKSKHNPNLVIEKPQSSEDKSLVKHLQNLGFKTINEYQEWCDNNRLSRGLYKSETVRKKEIDFKRKLYHEAAIEKTNKKVLKLHNQIKNHLKSPTNELYSHPQLREYYSYSGYEPNVKYTFKNSKIKEDEIEFLKFFAYIDKNATKLLEDKNYNKSLALIFDYRPYWIETYDNWTPTSKNSGRQFAELIRHLFTKYKMPTFLDSVWSTEGVINHQNIEFFIWIASGKNIRTAPNLPFPLTKSMAHHFLQAPSNYTIDQAFRYGKIIDMGGDKRLVDIINETRLGRNFQNAEFWTSVIKFFIDNPMLDRNQVGPIIDYINMQKFSAGAPHPGFMIKGRDPMTLLEQVEAWHQRLRKVKVSTEIDWKSSGIREFLKEEKTGTSFNHWYIVELVSSKDLQKEGKSLHHCVASYAKSAAEGRCAIFSIRKNDEILATVEVIPSNHSIVQVRGKFNALVGGKAWSMLQEWAGLENLRISCRGADQ